MNESTDPSGTPGMDCSEAIGRMFVFIDKELDQASCSDIQRHLDECGPCLAKYQLEVAVKALVARSCSEVAPVELRERVRLSIRQVSIRIEEA